MNQPTTHTDVDLQTETVPREVYLDLRRRRDRERKANDRVFLRLSDAVKINLELRDRIDELRAAKPDVAALLDARRDAAELAHALSSTLRVLGSVSKNCASTAAFVHELLVNKGYSPTASDLPEMPQCHSN